MRTLAAVLVTTLLATQLPACVHGNGRTSAGGVLLVAGGLATAGGAAMISSGNEEEKSAAWFDGNPKNDFNGLGDTLAGTLLVTLGLTLLVAGGILVGAGALEPEPPPVSYLPPPPPPAFGPTAAIVTPAEVASTEELPVLPTSPIALQLALQVRGLARRGECDAARHTLGAVELHDLAYAHALATSAAMAPCAH